MKNADMPAMPVTLGKGEVWSEEQDHADGLTKREYIAIAAMQGFLSGEAIRSAENTAKASVIQADALLAELEKTK